MSSRTVAGLGFGAFAIWSIFCVLRHYPSSPAVGGAPAASPEARSTVSALTLSPPFTAKIDGGKITLDGIVPDQSAREGVIARATELFGAGAFLANLKIMAPDSGHSFASDWLNRVLNCMGWVKRFAGNGDITFNGQTITLNGEVATAEVENKLLQDVSTALPGVTIIDRMTAIESLLSEREAKVQADLKKQIEGKTIEFALNSDKITPTGSAILDQVASILIATPDAIIEISGHTDNTGTENLNQGLSQRRAASVTSYLIGKGIAAARLSSRGYGSSQPIADNGTEEGRARNRRIEFRVIPGKTGK